MTRSSHDAKSANSSKIGDKDTEMGPEDLSAVGQNDEVAVSENVP